MPGIKPEGDFSPNLFSPDPSEARKNVGPTGADGIQELYGAEYYRMYLGPLPYDRTAHWLNFFGIIADRIVHYLRPRTVLDAGCAMGFLVEALRDRGAEAYGIDISTYAISKVRLDIAAYCRVASVTDPVSEHFDLVTCIEVLEHLRPEDTCRAVGNLCQCTDAILFSSTPTDIVEATHFNVRPTISWLQVFASFGFWPDVLFDAGFITPHAMVLRRSRVPEDDVLALFSELIRYKMALVSVTNERDANGQHISEQREEAAELGESISRLSSQLRKILDSPAWTLIQKYRAWRLRHSTSHPRIFAFYEGLVAPLLAWCSAFGHGGPQRSSMSTTHHSREDQG